METENYISICLGLKRKPSRKERKDWVNAVTYLFSYKITELYNLMKNNLDYFRIAFKEVHINDFKYNRAPKKAYRLFKKLNKSSKTKETEKALCEDKLIRSFFRIYRNNPIELIGSFLETDIKLRSLLLLQLIIKCKLYNKKTTEENLDIVQEIIDYKLSLKLSELRSRNYINIKTTVSSSLDDIYPISIKGGVLNAIHFYKLTSKFKSVDYIDLNTCGVTVNIQGDYSINSKVNFLNNIGLVNWKYSEDIKEGKDIILPINTSKSPSPIFIIDIINVNIHSIKFTLFTEQNPKNTCGNLYINNKMVESLSKNCGNTIIINNRTKEIVIFPKSIINNITNKIENIFELKKYPELSALGILKSIYKEENLNIQKSDSINDYSISKIILKE